jgi:hypothetical protein
MITFDLICSFLVPRSTITPLEIRPVALVPMEIRAPDEIAEADSSLSKRDRSSIYPGLFIS